MRLNFPDLHFRAWRPSLALAIFLLGLSAALAFKLNFWTSQAASQSPTQVAPKRKSQTPTFVPGEILVRFRESSQVSKSTAMVGARRSLSIVTRGRTINLQIEILDKGREIVSGLRFARVAPEDTLRAIESLNSRSDVLYAEPNFIRVKQVAPNDPRYVDMWNLKNTSGLGFGVAGADIKAEQAWDVTKGSRNIVVAVIDAEKDRAFVLMQYFGYMRRNAFDPPDADFAGYNFWLGKLNEFNGSFINAEMVKAFIQSGEYRQRFGP